MPAAYFVIMMIVVVIGYGVAFTRKGKVASATLGTRQHTFITAATPDQAFAAISTIGRPYAVDDRDPSSKVIVLSSPVTLFSWGFLYPIFLHADTAGTRVQIGCHSKVFQMGPLVTRAHDQARRAIEAALSVPTARVA